MVVLDKGDSVETELIFFKCLYVNSYKGKGTKDLSLFQLAHRCSLRKTQIFDTKGNDVPSVMSETISALRHV